MASITLNGKVTGLVRSRHWDKEKEFRIEVSLEREPSSRIPVADRYYCCSFYADEEEATTFRVGQQIRITIAQTEALAGATDGTKWGFTDRTSS